MPRPTTPKSIYFRTLTNGAVSFGEYINAKWYNCTDPFFTTNDEARDAFLGQLLYFQKSKSRRIELMAKGFTPGNEVKAMIDAMQAELNATAPTL